MQSVKQTSLIELRSISFLFSEFIPYVFQILSLLIELHKDSVPDTYMALFPHLLTPLLWERPGNIPPLVRLLQAYMEKGAKQVEPERLVSFSLITICHSLNRHAELSSGAKACYWHFFRLLMTFSNSLYQDQARQNVRPDLVPRCLTL